MDETMAVNAPEQHTPTYYTVGQLQAMVKEKEGKETKSRNRPALLKRLGLADAPKLGAKKKRKPVASKKTVAKPAKPVSAGVIRSDAERHATALAYVKRAMSRKEPPALRALCEELRKAKVNKPTGGTNWWPSSVQNLMRQAGMPAGGKPGNK